MTTVATEVTDSARAMWADRVIDQMRFAEHADRTLALFESDYPALMPSSEELDDLGFDTFGLASALEEGLDAELFGLTYRHLNIAEFNLACVALGVGLNVAYYNDAMQRIADQLKVECN